MDGRCLTCTHWSEFLDADDTPIGLGMCWLISRHRHGTESSLATISGDDDSLIADFQTRHNFGCVQYERKDAP